MLAVKNLHITVLYSKLLGTATIRYFCTIGKHTVHTSNPLNLVMMVMLLPGL